MLTNEEIYANIKKPTITETIRLHRLRWFGHVQRMEENRISKRVLYMNLETIRPRGRPRNRWLDEVSEDGRMVGGEEWQEKVYDREEWKRLLRTARNHRILHMPMDWLIDWLINIRCVIDVINCYKQPRLLNLLKPSGYFLYQQVWQQKNSTFCPHSVFFFRFVDKASWAG